MRTNYLKHSKILEYTTTYLERSENLRSGLQWEWVAAPGKGDYGKGKGYRDRSRSRPRHYNANEVKVTEAPAEEPGVL